MAFASLVGLCDKINNPPWPFSGVSRGSFSIYYKAQWLSFCEVRSSASNRQWISEPHQLYVCPRVSVWRGSQNESPLMGFPSDMTRIDVFNDYVQEFPKLAQALNEMEGSQAPSNPRTYYVFTRYWNKTNQSLPVSKPGSDFWDLCTSIRNDLFCLQFSDLRYICLSNLWNKHLEDARREHE